MIGAVARWKEMERWVPFGSTDLVAPHPIVPIGEVIVPRKEFIRPDQFGQAQPITIHFDGSIERRKRTAPFQGTMFAAYPGDLVFSKIDVRNGAIGILADEIPKAVVTAEYPVYRHDPDQLDARFFALVVRSPHFLKTLKTAATGHSGRKRISPEVFETFGFPLPELEEQRRLVASFAAQVKRAADLQVEATAKERQALHDFEAALGLTPPAGLPRRPFQVVHFRDLDRWSHEGVLQRILYGDIEPQSTFQMVQLEDIAKVSYGLQKCPTNRPGKKARPYLRVANVQRGFLDLRKIKYINVPDSDMPKYELQGGDILLCEGNSADLVGRGAIWRNEIPGCVHQNHVLRVRVKDRKAVLPDFILEYINSPQGQAYFRSKAKRTTNLATINSREVSEMPVPLPQTLAEQEQILSDLVEARRKAAELRDVALRMRTGAWGEFLAAVFE